MLKDIVILTLKGIIHRPLRSWLTILGIVLGIMLVVIILSLWNWIRKVVWDQMQMFWSSLIIIFPGEETNPLVWFMWWQKFDEKDLKKLEKIDWVEYVVPVEIGVLNVEYKWEKKSIMVHAAPWEGLIDIFETAQGVKLGKWSWPTSEETSDVVFGYLAYEKLFKNKVSIWDEVLIKSKKMKIKWYVTEIWNQMDDNVIYISLENFRILTWVKWKAWSAFVKIKEWADTSLISRQIKFELNKQEVVRDFSIITPQKANQLIWGIIWIIELFLVIIALISLIVWAVWVTNTMYTSVLERTKQIGIMKAIWASREAILSLFLIESWLIWLVWWSIWILLGLLFSFLIWIASEAQWTGNLFSFSSIDYYWLLVVLLITFVTWIVSWILPARQAANMEAAEALRYE